MERSWRRWGSEQFSVFSFSFLDGCLLSTNMIRQKEQPGPEKQIAEPETGRPSGTGEEWLGRNRSSKRRLWERLNPRSRKQIHVIAQALALQQMHARLPDPLRARLSAAVEELERHLARIRALLGEVARRTPRGE
jgi:hypothetical protein